MEKQIRDRYSDAILHEAMRRYGIASDKIQALKGFESFIYTFERDSQSFILRIGHSLRRSEPLIQGEVDWINYLADNGVSVARAILSENGRLVESIDDGQAGQFLATAFVKAQGQPPWGMWTPALHQRYGQLLGSMHALAARYQPSNPAWKRPEWNDPGMEFAEQYLPASEDLVKQKYRTLCAHLRSLPKAPTSYGLIHQDAHGNNFLVDADGKLTLFDFDDCVYSWYTNDIAIVLFYRITEQEDWSSFTREFMIPFLQGYQQAYTFDPAWLKQIPSFLKLRELDMYAVIHRDFDVNNIENAWCARFMHNRKARIENDVPFVDFDFESLTALL